MEEIFSLYNGKIKLTTVFTSNRHEYRINGKITNGVTTILGILDKPMLLPWAVKETVKELGYYEKTLWTPDGYIPLSEEDQAIGFERMVSIHNRIKTMDVDEYWQTLHNSKGASRRKKEGAADNGTLVHLWVEQYIKGEKPAMPTMRKVKNGVDAFLQWVNNNKVEFVLSEAKIYSKKYKFCGTLDFTAIVNGVPTMGDIKTSNFFSPEMFWQVSAYQHARLEEYPKERYDQQTIVRCGKDGTLEVISSTDYEKDIKAFVACQVIFNRKKEIKANDNRD